MPFKESTTSVKPLRGESDFASWKRRIRGQLEAFDLWQYAEGTVPAPTLRENENQDDFVERQREHRMERGQTMHLIENAIHDEAFETLRSYGYDLENRDPKTLIDTLSEVFIKTTTGSVQSMGAELFTLDADNFDITRPARNATKVAMTYAGCYIQSSESSGNRRRTEDPPLPPSETQHP
jgi:hypothetical protein